MKAEAVVQHWRSSLLKPQFRRTMSGQRGTPRGQILICLLVATAAGALAALRVTGVSGVQAWSDVVLVAWTGVGLWILSPYLNYPYNLFGAILMTESLDPLISGRLTRTEMTSRLAARLGTESLTSIDSVWRVGRIRARLSFLAYLAFGVFISLVVGNAVPLFITAGVLGTFVIAIAGLGHIVKLDRRARASAAIALYNHFGVQVRKLPLAPSQFNEWQDALRTG